MECHNPLVRAIPVIDTSELFIEQEGKENPLKIKNILSFDATLILWISYTNRGHGMSRVRLSD